MHKNGTDFIHGGATRRDFIRTTGAALAALSLPEVTRADSAPVRIGSGSHTYELDPNWGRLPEGMTYGFGCAIVVDAKNRILVTSRSSNPCLAIFDRHGKLLETWTGDLGEKIGYTTDQIKATAHGLFLSNEGGREFLYFTENVAGGKNGAPRIGARVYKTDMHGRVLHTIGNVDAESATSQKFDWTNPTDVAVAANGDIYVVDGYGSQRVSRFDKHFKHIKTIGSRTEKSAVGPNAPHGTFNTCHGVWINTLKSGPEVYIADRHNDRIEVYSLELEYKRTINGDFVRNPCCFYQHKGNLYIPDLGGMVTIIDADDKPVATLGDGKGVKKEEFQTGHPDKFATPHALTVDSHGDFYIVEWLPYGRVRKFRHVAA